MECKIDLDDPKFVYFLGLIWGDGYIRPQYGYLGLEIKSTDFEYVKPIVKSFCDVIETTRLRNQDGINRQQQSIINISNKELGTLLLNCDYHNKSYITPTKILSLISYDLHHYWLRGYFDADGCWYNNKNYLITQGYLSSTYEQDWSYIHNWLTKINVDHKIKQQISKTNTYSFIRFCSKESIYNFGKYIYNGDWFGYDRKYQKWLSMLNHKKFKNYKSIYTGFIPLGL